MSVQGKKQVAALSEDDRKRAAWDNAEETSDPLMKKDRRHLLMHWDQHNKHSRYGWIIEEDEAGNPRARHWCKSPEHLEAALLMDP